MMVIIFPGFQHTCSSHKISQSLDICLFRLRPKLQLLANVETIWSCTGSAKQINLRCKAKKDCHSTDYAESRLNVRIRSSPMPVIYKPLWGPFDETGDWHPSNARQNLVSGFSKRPKDFSCHGSSFFSLNVLLTTFDQDKCFLIHFWSQFYFYLK